MRRYTLSRAMTLHTLFAVPGLLSLSAFPAFSAALQATQGQNQAEVTTRDTAPTFQVRANLVLVPVVVRDAKGNTVGNLTREDFLLSDQGKPQMITKFSVEKTGGQAPDEYALKGRAPGPPAAMPERFVAYLFDDMHLTFAQMTMAREAAERHVANSPESPDRLAVFTTSGNAMLDFTDDRQKVKQTLAGLRPRREVDLERRDIPALTYYEANEIRNKSNWGILNAATREVLEVSGTVKLSGGIEGRAIFEQASEMARVSAARVLAQGPQETRASLDALKGLVRRIAAMPGQRTIVLISPGFFTLYERRQLVEIIDLAVRLNVIVHTLDPAGIVESVEWARSVALPSNRDTLISVAEGTGGTFFHNQNDLDLGFKRTAGAPEFRYLLGFTPESLKSDGSFHDLKVKLRNAQGQSVQARHGYFAPDGSADPAQAAKQEMEDALFSRQEIRGVPTEVHTEFFKPSDDRARLSVVVRIDVKQLPYRKVDGRNRDDLTVISALFDRNGNYAAGTQKAIEIRLRDQTLASEGGPPVAVKSSFNVKPGTYMIRVVVRDAEGQRMTAANSVVEIP